MEKQRARHFAASISGLLICANAFAARNESASQSYQFLSTAAGETLTDTELCFTMGIDEAPERVAIQVPDWPSGVHFVSSSLAADGAGGGTKLTVVLMIKAAGDYTLPPAGIKVRGQRRLAAFPPIHAVQNPATAIPALTLIVEDMADGTKEAVLCSPSSPPPALPFAVPAGRKMRLTLAPSNAKVESTHWEVPADVIMQAEGIADSLTEKAPAAFLWQPLKAGETSLPVIECKATALNGKAITFTTPPVRITVTPPGADTAGGVHNDETEKASALFPKAFDDAPTSEAQGTAADEPLQSGECRASLPLTRAQCERLARLREAERRALFPWGCRRERAEYEKSLGMEAGANEMSHLPPAMCIALFAVSVVLFTVCAARRQNKALAIIMFAFAAAFATLAILCANVLSSRKGIFAGNAVRTIPDSSDAVIALDAGTEVQIVDSVTPHLYVRSGAISGWALSEDVIVIR